MSTTTSAVLPASSVSYAWSRPSRVCLALSRNQRSMFSVCMMASPRDHGPASIAAAHQPEMVAKVRLQPARPVALARLLPLGGLLHLGSGEMIERHVLAVAARAPEAARGEDAGNGAEGRDVLLVVPLVELGLEFGGDVHRVQQEPAGLLRRQLVAGQGLL